VQLAAYCSRRVAILRPQFAVLLEAFFVTLQPWTTLIAVLAILQQLYAGIRRGFCRLPDLAIAIRWF